MAKTISANSGPITLSTTADNPLAILSGVTVSAFSGIAVYGDNSQAWTITNAGTISSTSPSGYGIELEAGGTVTNTGRVSAGVTGVRLKGTPATATNQGSISGGDDGVILSAGGTVANTGTAASISGGVHGVYVFGARGTVTNQGAITGTGTNSDGVKLLAGGSVSNSGIAASISGGQWGVYLTGTVAAVITNQGTISGVAGAIHFGNANFNELYLFPGAVTNGAVLGGTGTGNVLLLGAGPAFGVISGIGSQFTGFGLLEVAAHAQWLMTGSNTITASTQIVLSALATLEVGGTLVAPTNLNIIAGISELAAGDGGRIEVGTAGTARAGQIIVDAGHTIIQTGTVLMNAPVIINRGVMTGGDIGLAAVGASSSVTNSGAAASISGMKDGFIAEGQLETMTNQGAIFGGNTGADFLSAGSLSNSGTAARITGGTTAVDFQVAASTLSNQGTLVALTGGAVYLVSGIVTNTGTAADIAGGSGGVISTGGVVNAHQPGHDNRDRNERRGRVARGWRGGEQRGNGRDNFGYPHRGLRGRWHTCRHQPGHRIGGRLRCLFPRRHAYR